MHHAKVRQGINMAQEPISQLTTGIPQGTDETPATDPTDTTQASSGTTKKYIRSAEVNYYLKALGIINYPACQAASPLPLTATYNNGTSGVGATLTNNGVQTALIIDGYTCVVGDRILIANQTTDFQNGIYTVTNIGSLTTNWVLTRATDYDTPSEIIQYSVTLINFGTTYKGLLLQLISAGPYTVGVTSLNYALYTAQSLTIPVSLAQGGTSASLTASNGGIFYSTATAGAILAGVSSTNNLLMSGGFAAPFWSTATYPSTTTINQLLYSNANNTVTGLATANNGLLVTSAAGVPSISTTIPSGLTGAALTRVNDTNVTVTLGGSPTTALLNATSLTLGWTGTLSVSRGGTGLGTLTTYAILAGGTTATGNLQQLGTGTTGQLLQSQGAAALASFTTATYPSTATSAGTILRADGTNWVGTTTTYPATNAINTIMYASSANALGSIAAANSSVLVTSSSGVPSMSGAMTNGQLIIGSTGATPTAATLTAGTGITISNAAGSITISGAGSGYSWTEVTGTSQSMAVNNGYIANNVALVTLTLPASAALGDTVILQGKGAGLFKIAQNSGQTIRFGNVSTTTGVGGSLTAISQYNSVELLCITATTDWAVLTGTQGSFTVV